MIVGSMKHWSTERQYAHPVLRKAIDYLAETDLGMLEVGKYPIWGDNLYARVMAITTKPKAEQPAEKHERFLDIHYLLEGEESIGWQLQDGHCEPSQAYDPDGDYSLFAELPHEKHFKLIPGMYMVFFPEDIHRPGLTESSASDVRKVVIKLNQTLFEGLHPKGLLL